MIPLSKFSEHSQIAVMTSVGLCWISNLRNLGLDLTITWRYGRLLLMRFDMWKMTAFGSTHGLRTFNVDYLSFSWQNVGSQSHVFWCQLMTVDHQISIRFICSIVIRLQKVFRLFRKHLSGKRCNAKRIAWISKHDQNSD